MASSGLSRVPAEKSVARGSGTLLGHCFVLALQEMPMPLETETWLSVDGQHESWLAELLGILSGSLCSASSTYIYLIPLQRIVLGNKPQRTVVGNIWRRSIVLPHANSSGEEATCCMQQFKKKKSLHWLHKSHMFYYIFQNPRRIFLGLAAWALFASKRTLWKSNE